MKAKYWISKNNSIQCDLCPRNCIIKKDTVGYCKVRKNIDNKLTSLVYGKSVSINTDPIEKKPLFHFFPGKKVFSFGTVGCNLKCLHCQNFEISQEYDLSWSKDLPPKKIIEMAKSNNIQIIAATYNEPTIFFEYMLDTFKLAKKENIKTVIVSNGFINPKPLKELIPYLDAANIDIKAFDNNFYKKITTAWIKPILETCKTLNNKIWLEITNLIIPTKNDSDKMIKDLCKWVYNLNPNIPLHFTAFYPQYKMSNLSPTSKAILIKAYNIAKETGIKYPYIGNIFDDKESTFCPNCNKILIKRTGYKIIENNIKNSKCKHCNTLINGIWS